MITNCFNFSKKFPSRLLFRENSEQSWDYAQLNSRINSTKIIDVGLFTISRRFFEFGKDGVSGNLKRGLAESNYAPIALKGVLFEVLQAVDSECRHNGMTLDTLEAQLITDGVTQFSLENGFLYFFDKEGGEIFKFNAISERQKDFKENFYAKTATLKHMVGGNLVERQTRGQLRRAAIETMGPSDDSQAVSVRLPNLPPKPPFKLPGLFWIETSKVPPQGLMRRYRGKTACMGYVGERLRQRLGYSRGLQALGFRADHPAWQFKSDLMRNGGVEVVSSMQDHLFLSGGTIQSRGVGTTDDYKQEFLAFRWAMDQRLANNDSNPAPFVLTLRYRASWYAGQSAAYNARLDPAKQSLNTHILEGLGKGKRDLPGEPHANEELTTFATRAIGVLPKDVYLFSAVTLWVDGELFHYDTGRKRFLDSNGAIKQLNANSRVQLEDIYFAHHFKGARIDSLTSLMASGKYDPVEFLSLTIKEPKEAVPQVKLPEGVELQTSFYLKKGETLRTRFAQLSNDPEDWERICWFWNEIGFDTGRVKPDIEPVPIPWLDKLKTFVAEKGGLPELRAITERARIAEYNKAHPGEHVMRVESGDDPWKLVAPFFNGKFRPALSAQERSIILSAIDRFNPSIDLRIVAFSMPDGWESQKDYVRFQQGAMLWFSDELIDALTHNILFERNRVQVHIPDALSIATEGGVGSVEITAHERYVIETVTPDPQMRLLLILTLLNEQKGGTLRGYAARVAEKVGIHHELSVGLFQVQPREADRLMFNRNGYEFVDFETYRDALKTDDVLNAKAAAMALKEASDSYRYFLGKNEETPQPTDPHFLSGVLTAYNRPRARLYDGLFSLMAERVAQAFLLSTASAGTIDGNDPERTVQLWCALGQELLNKHVIPSPSVDSPQIETDAALLKADKIDFFKTALFRSVQAAYKAKTGVRLSFLIEDPEYQTSSFQNYGYRAIRHGQVGEILNHSALVNAKELNGRRLIVLEELPSIRSKQRGNSDLLMA